MKLKRLFFSCLIFLSLHLSAQPTLSFARSFGGSVLEGSTAIKADNFGNVYTIGTFAGTADFDTGPGVSMVTSIGDQDIFILKLDSLGNFIWNKHIGGIQADFATGLALDDTGNVYITGTFVDSVDFDPGPGVMNFMSYSPSTFIMKIDASGNLVWAERLESPLGFNEAASIALDESGNVICTGRFRGDIDFDPGMGVSMHSESEYNVNYLLKLSNSGAFIFAKDIIPSQTTKYLSLATDPAGNIYMCGSFNDTIDTDPGPGVAYLLSPNGYDEGFVAKYSGTGNLVWSKALGENPTIPNTQATSVGLDASGNVYVCGYFSNNCDFDPGSGTFTLGAAGGNIDIFSVKLSNSGNFIWAQNIPGDDVQAFGMYVDEFGNQTIAGHFEGTVDCDPSAANFNLISNSAYFDVLAIILDASGNLKSAFKVGSAYHDYGYAVDVKAPHIFMTGAYSLTCDFDPDIAYVPYTSQGNVDVFVAKYNGGAYLPLATAIHEEEKNQISVFPNPADDNLLIRWTGGPATIYLLNGFGQKVIHEQSVKAEVITFDLQALPVGIYFLVVDSEAGHACEKIIKK